MQVKDPTGSSTTTGEPAKGPGLWKHIQAWDGKLSVAKGLTAVTLLTGFLGGYFQYLGAYEDKVSEQAKTDMAAATQTFLDITNSFAEAQMLQQLIYFDYAATLGEPDPGNSKMVTQAGYRDVSGLHQGAQWSAAEHHYFCPQGRNLYRLAEQPQPRPCHRAGLGRGSADRNTAWKLQFRLRRAFSAFRQRAGEQAEHRFERRCL